MSTETDDSPRTHVEYADHDMKWEELYKEASIERNNNIYLNTQLEKIIKKVHFANEVVRSQVTEKDEQYEKTTILIKDVQQTRGKIPPLSDTNKKGRFTLIAKARGSKQLQQTLYR